MKHLNFLSNLLSLSLGSSCTDVSLDRRLTVGSPSGRYCSGLMRLVFILAILLTVGVGEAWGAKITYTFSTKSWAASPANWTSGKDGNQFTKDQGIQVNTGTSGANGTSPLSFTGISKIEVAYCTNASSGVGTIKVKVGSGTEQSFSVTKPSSGGTTLKTATFNFSPVETGSVKVTGNCTTNSVYIWSVTIYYQTAVTLNKNGGTSDGSVKFQHDATTYVTSSFTPVTRSGYNCTGYWTASSGGTKILNADGTRAGNVSGWWESNKWSKTDATATLYAQWEADAPASTIAAQSNDNSLGTVSLSGTTITATPAACCEYASPAYTISPAGSATVSQDGNAFTVTPSANTTITINFQEKSAGKTVNFDAGAGVCATASLTEDCDGAGVVLPSVTASGVCKGWTTFAGWATTPVTDSTTTSGVTLYAAGDNFVPSSNGQTLYAVYSKNKGGGSASTSTLTNSSIVSSGNSNGYKTYCTSDCNKSPIDGWSGKFAVNYVSSGTHYSVQLGRATTSSASAYNTHLTSPTYASGATHISLTLSTSANQVTANGRKFYLMDTDELNYTAADQTSSYGVGTYDNSDDNYEVSFDVTGSPTQFHIYADGIAYIKTITVTYGGSTTYYCSDPNCCTPLGSINGSVSWSNVSPTSVTVEVPSDYSDRDNANLTGYIFKRYSALTGGTLLETIETNSASATSATFSSGLVANTTYYYTITAKHESSSCNSEETSPRKSYTITSYTVSYAAGGGSGSNPGAHDPVLSGTSVTLKGNTFTAPTGKEFAGWNDGSNDYSVGASYSVTGNKTMTAQWSCITPSISGHPSSASYTQGASPANLSVTASGGTLSYQWKQCATIDGTYVNVASGGTSSTYSPSTASVGTTYYKCVVTNTGSSCNTTATSNVATITISAASQCVAPTFSVAAGTYNSAQTVTISSTTPGSTIYYTTNGDEPTTSSSHGTEGEASASVTVSSSLTLKAIAYKGGMTTSDVSDAAYVICSTDPSFSTTSSSNITITGARVTCAGITKGTCDIDAYGIVYGTSEHPTGNAQQKGTDASTNVSSYYVDLTGLTAATTYYARPYATVNGKTVYGTEISFTTLHIPEITVSETSRAFGTKKVDGSYEMSFTVSGEYLQSNIGLAISGTNEAMFSVDKTSLTPSTGTVGSTTVTVTYTPSAAGLHSATVSITSTNATTQTVTLSGTGQYEDTYMTAMHEGVTAWSDYATGVTKSGAGYTIPNPGDVAKAGTGCEGIHYHFAGWVADTYKASPSGHIMAASGTTDATNTTYWAVWEKEEEGSVPEGWYETAIGSLTASDVFVIVGNNDSTYAMTNNNGTGAAPSASSVTISEGAITTTVADNIKWNISGNSTDGYVFYPNGSTTTWLYCTNTNNGVRVGTNDNKAFTISDGGYLYNTGTSRYVGIYNNQDWRCYTSINDNIKDQTFAYYAYVAASYEDPKVECVCSADPDAGTAAVDATGTFSVSRIDVKATEAGTGHADCSYTDYGFVWSGSVTTPTLVEATGVASTNCTKIPVGTDGEVTSFTGSLSGSFSAGNAIYFRSYVKNGKEGGTYQYSDVVTVTPRSVTFNLNGHGSSTPTTQFVNNGSKATDPSYAESVTGYTFGGWYKEAGCTNAWNFASDVVSGENKTLYAKWTPISYSVRFNDNDENYLGTATGSMDNQSFVYDASKALTANGFSLDGYDFAGWATTADGSVAHDDKEEVSNLSSTNGATVDLYAIWTAKTYDVTLAATNETGSVGSQTVTATYNAAMPTTKKGGGAVAAPSRTGYTFAGWEYSPTTYYNYDAGTGTLTSAHVWDIANSTTTLTPKWSINSYTLTWNLDGGTVSVAGTGAAAGATGTPSSSVEYNAEITVPTVTKAGYTFAGWDVDVAATMPAEATTYTATWTAKTLNSISLAEASVSVYVGEIKYVNVIFDPTDILSKAFSQSATPTYCQLSSYDSYNKLKITGGRSGADISVNRTETVSIKYTADETKTASISVTVKPLPTVTFVDLIHNKLDFANSGDGWTAGTGVLSSTVTTGVVSHAKKTPTHTDVSAPVGGNACETGHLHLMGWIRSDYEKVAAYMAGTGAAPTVSELTSAGTGYWFTPNADINVETYNGKTFYAVWAVEE